jgi:hypothetical protein
MRFGPPFSLPTKALRRNLPRSMLFALPAAFVGVWSVLSVEAQTIPLGGVHGSVFTPVLRDRVGLGLGDLPSGIGKRIYLPQLTVHLVAQPGDTKVASTTTDLFGRYYFRHQPAGEYKVCWDSPGWKPGCSAASYQLQNNIAYPPSIAIEPVVEGTGAGAHGAFWGSVALADQSSPYFHDEYLGISRTADISVTDLSGTTLSSTVSNAWGLYVVVNVPTSQVRATAKIETAHATIIAPAATVATGAKADFLIPNKRPLVLGVAAKLNGVGVREAPQGAELSVGAQLKDPDGDPLTFSWKPGPGSGQVASSSGNNAVWKLANLNGAQTLYVAATDNKGGWISRSVTIVVGDADASFSGKVVTQSGVPIPTPTVAVNGKQLASDINGAFNGQVPRSARYVVNVSAAGFAPASRIFDQSGLYGVYKLVRTSVSQVDPTTNSRVVAKRQDRTAGQEQVRPATIVLPAGSLVDAEGKPPSGPVLAHSASLDIANGEMPGDFGARSGSAETNLISYGAIFAEFTDGAGKRYNLAPGQTAQVIIPAPPSLKNPPATIALWSYNDKTGYWDDMKTTATYNAANRQYVGKVLHFSTINTDISKTTAACVRILLDNVDRNQLKARVSFSSGPTPFAQTPEFLLGDSLNAIYRLPANDNVQVTILDATNNNAIPSAQLFDANQAPLNGNIVNTGAPSTPLWPAIPYDSCVTTSVRLAVPTGSISQIPFLTFPAIGTDPQAIGYYSGIDPAMTYNGTTWSGGTHSTLGAWWSQAGFASDGSGGTRAAYLNNNDLGFGRDMHIIRDSSTGNVFGYVTNYGNHDQNPGNADLAQTANKATAVATVAMEYSPLSGVSGSVVKFFVFKGGDGNAPLVNSADLDGFGQKFVPNLCQNCHGGEFYSPANPASPSPLDLSLRASLAAAVGASFREFDTDSFKYPGGNNTLPAGSRSAFYNLNQLVLNSNPQQPIQDLINGWYGGLANPSTDPPNTSFTPTGWIDASQPQKQQLYLQVVSKSCRTCHVAFSQTSAVSGITWTTYPQFQAHQQNVGTVHDFVCGDSKLMPHALITYRNFWLSTGPHRPDVLGTFSAPDWTAFSNGCQ